jgi:hypothetical protein
MQARSYLFRCTYLVMYLPTVIISKKKYVGAIPCILFSAPVLSGPFPPPPPPPHYSPLIFKIVTVCTVASLGTLPCSLVMYFSWSFFLPEYLFISSIIFYYLFVLCHTIFSSPVKKRGFKLCLELMNSFLFTGAGALGIQVEGPAEAKMTCTGKFFPLKGLVHQRD